MSGLLRRSAYVPVAILIEEKFCWYQPKSAGLVSQIPLRTGLKERSRRWHQRAIAEANSRPIKPQPMMPKRISLMRPCPRADSRQRQRVHRRELGVSVVNMLLERAS